MSAVLAATPYHAALAPRVQEFAGGTMVEDRSYDSELLLRMQAGDDSALALLYDRHGALAFTLAYRMLSDRHLAEDVVQEVFLSIWKNASRFDPRRSSFRTWFVTIVRNRCFDKLRGSAARPQVSAEIEIAERPGTHDVPREVNQTLTAEAVQDALSTLPPEQRETIELAYYGGLSQTEISERMGVPLGTVKGRVRMAMQKLRELLAGMDVEGLA
jgi:RNA polymerase sigma-70 factor (ECF subfamily)